MGKGCEKLRNNGVYLYNVIIVKILVFSKSFLLYTKQTQTFLPSLEKWIRHSATVFLTYFSFWKTRFGSLLEKIVLYIFSLFSEDSEGNTGTTEDSRQWECPSVGWQSNTVLVFSKDLANNKPAILPLIPARAAEQATIQSVCKYLEDINKIKNAQHRYLKNSLWLAG